ncbi:hypothetical protein [Streptomyces sp. B15]|uniref:hypothetical protein n=1 Tax=Streptomyces sp. B15 TaxID=1537797 RepID=UPI001B3934BB|nr:hypothetical protein [Streptomyces sp. B15]MBQ1122583.1 hypothetical protein [Streptomyces sp. B15]
MVLAKIGATLGICGGAITLAYATATGEIATAIAGGTTAVAALLVLGLVYVRGWVCDTTAARARYDQVSTKLEDERRRYVAFQASLQAERDRVRAEIAASRAALSEQLRIERDRLEQEFEDQRGELMRTSFEAGVDFTERGLLDPAAPGAQVIRLPDRSPHPETASRPAP